MNPIQLLMSEHRLIEQVLAALEGYARRVAEGETLEREDLGRFTTFIREYADTCHHGKEEEVLFAAMVRHGFPEEGGPIGVMLHEHEQGRAYVRVLVEAAEAPAEWDRSARARITNAATGYVGLLRDHILKEDNILYRMAEMHLSHEAMQEVATGCEGVERKFEGEKPRLEEMAQDLVRRHAPDAA